MATMAREDKRAAADAASTETGGLVPLHDRASRVEFACWFALWLALAAHLWVWWFNPSHVVGPVWYALVTLSLAWVTVQPLYFLAIFQGARKPAGPCRLPAGSRVAMVVTKAPSEPFDVVARTLEAMLAQDYPHDTWLADEDPSPDTLAWCAARGVKVSTRRNRPDYHRPTWPRRTRCKEGNLAFFYDQVGYRAYDFVAQLDADHVPAPGYLRQMLTPFADPRVGYVSAPSICDANAADSWSARARLYVEASLHGSLQAGYNSGWAPLCIGSHYAVRTAALEQIGGLGPELAEDHSTTLMMNAFGWRGVHAIDAIAHGDGPATFADLATQELQWSRSIMTILLQYARPLIGRLPWRLRFQFLFAQLWYPLFSLFMATAFLLPLAAILTGEPPVAVPYVAFLAHFLPVSLLLVVMAFRWRAKGSFRPADAKILSWEGLVFTFARWPWSLIGCALAVRDAATGSFVDFRITPKGRTTATAVPLRVLAPYLLLSAVSAAVVLLAPPNPDIYGYYAFATINGLIYGVIAAIVVVMHAKESHKQCRSLPPCTWRFGSVATCSVVLALSATAIRGAEGVQGLADGTLATDLTRPVYTVAGAGLGEPGRARIVFELPRVFANGPEGRAEHVRERTVGPAR